jgi:hypothetical protein
LKRSHGFEQGDQIGTNFRLLSDCLIWPLFVAIVTQRLKILNIWGKKCVLILTSIGLGEILGDFFSRKLIWSPWPSGRMNKRKN